MKNRSFFIADKRNSSGQEEEEMKSKELEEAAAKLAMTRQSSQTDQDGWNYVSKTTNYGAKPPRPEKKKTKDKNLIKLEQIPKAMTKVKTKKKKKSKEKKTTRLEQLLSPKRD